MDEWGIKSKLFGRETERLKKVLGSRNIGAERNG